MKKSIALLLAWLLSLSVLAGCGSREKKERPGETELTVFAAASLQESLTELGKRYMQERDGVRLVFNFESSGTLQQQIAEGAEADIFISAGQWQMDRLAGAEAGNEQGLDLLLAGSRFDILENRLVLAVPEGDPAGVGSFAGLVEGLENKTLLLAIGGSDVPAGEYSRQLLAHYGLSEETLERSGCITYGSNVKEIAVQIAEATVDCGLIYLTDARAAGLQVVDTAAEGSCSRTVYPAALLKSCRDPAQAEDFLDYLTSDTAAAVFRAQGFIPLS